MLLTYRDSVPYLFVPFVGITKENCSPSYVEYQKKSVLFLFLLLLGFVKKLSIFAILKFDLIYITSLDGT